MNKREILTVAIALSLLAGCGPVGNFKLVTMGVTAAANGFFERTDVNLKEKNYAVADYMAVPMREHIDRDDLIVIHPLTEADNGKITSPLGMMIPEEVGLRLMQLGFRVALHQVASDMNSEIYLAPKDEADFIFTGHYMRGKTKVDIVLRVKDVKTQEVVAAFEYALPLTREIQGLADTQPRIFKVAPSYQ